MTYIEKQLFLGSLSKDAFLGAWEALIDVFKEDLDAKEDLEAWEWYQAFRVRSIYNKIKLEGMNYNYS